MDINSYLEVFGINNIYHMTHISNVPSILQRGLYPHKNPFQQVDISDCDVNSRRSRNEPIYNKPIHSYIPFYFNPKNNMLSKRRSIQKDIVILVFPKDLILSQGAIFTDGNASTDRTRFYNRLNDLDKLNWDCIYTSGYYSGYPDGARTRMSEVLVPDYVSAEKIEGIICHNHLTRSMVEQYTNDKIVSVNTKMYF